MSVDIEDIKPLWIKNYRRNAVIDKELISEDKLSLYNQRAEEAIIKEQQRQSDIWQDIEDSDYTEGLYRETPYQRKLRLLDFCGDTKIKHF